MRPSTPARPAGSIAPVEGIGLVKLAEEQIHAPPQGLHALEEAFAHFSRQTAQLREAYRKLEQRAEQVNLELEAANCELARKVQELDEAYNFQHSILESIPIAVVVTDLDGNVRALNAAAEDMWAVRRQEALGRHFQTVMESRHTLLAGVLAGSRRLECQRRQLGGPEAKIISSTACLVANSAGQSIGAVQLDRDITALSALQQELYEQGKLADLGKMAAGLAHEIRKPLNGIKGFASILQRKSDDDAKRQHYIANIMGAADRLNGLLGRLLDFARPEGLHLTTCDLRAVAEQIAEFVRVETRSDSARIHVEIPEKARWVSADPDKIKQVLLNLIQNGVEALQGPGTVRVAASVRQQGGQKRVRVQVRDTGKGISSEQAGMILEPFYTSKENGTGLGLPIVHRILQLHCTQLDIDSKPGRGTTMSFLLPLAAGAEEA